MPELTDTERLKALRQRMTRFADGLDDAATVEARSGNPVVAMELRDVVRQLRMELQGDLVGG